MKNEDGYVNMHAIKKLKRIKTLWAKVGGLDKNRNLRYTYAQSPLVWSTKE